MRILYVLLMIIGFVSFATAQNKNQDEPSNVHFYPFMYESSNKLKAVLDQVTTVLKSSPGSKIYIIYNKGQKRSKIKFDKFKSKVLKMLVKSNQIEFERVSVIDSGNFYDDDVSFRIWIIDKNGNRIYPS